MKAKTKAPGNREHVLVVEDSKTQAMRLEFLLEESGYSVTVAEDGSRALGCIESRKPDLIISDIVMPGMDGFELCKCITEQEALKHLPIVLLSQLSDPKDIERGLACGAETFIVKPYRDETLLAKIDAILGRTSGTTDKGEKTKLLVVEDSRTQAEHLDFILGDHGFHVSCAGNGAEALEAIKKDRPDIVISDVIMPEMDGYEMCEKMRKTPGLHNVPLIMLTSLLEPQDVIRGIVSGVDYYLTKPYEDRYLISTLDFIIKSGESRTDEQVLEDIEFRFGGKSYCISISPRRLLNLLLSTYENAVWQNRELRRTETELTSLNSKLEQEIQERRVIETQLRKYQERLEELVQERTAELSNTNVQLQREVAERKQAEVELQKTYADLRRAHEQLEQSQAQLIRTEKMSALGTLVAGVAHELNNPMMGILQFSQYCVKHTQKDDKRYDVLRDIEHETKRCIDIVQNLLTFSHTGKGQPARYSKSACSVPIERVLKLLSYRIEKQKVSVGCHVAEGTPDVRMNAGQIQEVLLNIVCNALDAVQNSDRKEISIDVRAEDGSAVVTVTDSGCGVPSDKIGKIFDPFYTTKPVGKGTGLGLSLCRSIMEDHGGEIICRSEPGSGTELTVKLPIKSKKGEEKCPSESWS